LEHRVHGGRRLRPRDSRFEATDDRHVAEPCVLVCQKARRVEGPDGERKRDVRTVSGIETTEAGSGDTDNRDGSAVDHQRAPKDVAVTAELPRPIAIAEYGNERACTRSIVFRSEPPPENHRYAEDRVVVAGNELSLRRLDAVPGRHLDGAPQVRRYTGKRVCARADTFEVGIVRSRSRAAPGAVRDKKQGVRFVNRQCAQHDGLEEAEDRRICADAERQGQDHDRRKARIAPQRAERVPHILAHLLEPWTDPDGARVLLRPRNVAEAEHRLTACFLRRHAPVDVVPGFLLDVIADVLVDAIERSFAAHLGRHSR
jgi:hypothetical protein